MALLKNLQESFKTDPDKHNNPTTVEQSTLKILVGLLGVFLPFILWIGLLLYQEHPSTYYPIESISHYYYTRMSSWFVVTMSLLAVILIFYKGKTKEDVRLSTAAGIFALIVVLLPTTELAEKLGDPTYAVTYIGDTKFYGPRTTTHFISAGLFLLCLAIISFRRFPKTDTSPEFERNKSTYTFVYRACGVIMAVSILAIFLGTQGIIFPIEWFERKINFKW